MTIKVVTVIGENKVSRIRMRLDIISKKYCPENQRCDTGLIVNKEGSGKIGYKMNQMLQSRIVLLMTRYGEEVDVRDFSIDKEDDFYTLPDILLNDMEEIFSMEKLVGYYINGEGNALFQEITAMLGEEKAEEFYRCIDKYDEDRIGNRKKYDLFVEKLRLVKQNQKTDEQTPYM